MRSSAAAAAAALDKKQCSLETPSDIFLLSRQQFTVRKKLEQLQIPIEDPAVFDFRFWA